MNDAMARAAIRLVRLCVALVAFAGSASACAAKAGTQPTTATPTTITGEDVRNAGLLGATAYEVVRRLRPGFLMNKTSGSSRTLDPILVSVNHGRLSPINALNSIPASTINEIRYLTGGEAAQRFSTRTNGPVIVVVLLSPPAAEP